ncbi:hypothetical protein [Varibaculum vaginae]|uniref:hypothetical protein n=1 Tax=Varibaculum vaginae TaxID=2364797 RepID=UPI0011C397A6|nr:hypothetical protein [Varibaculum vaginae]
MKTSQVSAVATARGRMLMRLLAVLLTLVLIDLALTVYVFVLSGENSNPRVAMNKRKEPAVSTVVKVPEQLKEDSFTPYIANESSPAVIAKGNVDIWLIFITSEGARAQALSLDGKVKGEPLTLPACDNGLAQPYEVFGGQIVCKGALGEKDYSSVSAAKSGKCAGEIIYRDSQVTVCASPSAKQSRTVSYLQKGKTIWQTSLPGKPSLAANSKFIWATRTTDSKGKISYQRFDIPGVPDLGTQKPAGWDAIKKVDFQNIDIASAEGESRKLTDGRFKASLDPSRDVGLAVGVRQNDKVYADINGDGYLDFAQVLYYQDVSGQVPEGDQGEYTYQGTVQQVLVWIWDPQSNKPQLMDSKLLSPKASPLCGSGSIAQVLFAADLSVAQGYGLSVKYLYSDTSWDDVVVAGASHDLLTQATETEQAQYRVIGNNLVRFNDGTYSAVMPAEACINPTDSDSKLENVPDLLPLRDVDSSLSFSPRDVKYQGYYWFPTWKDPQGNILWYGINFETNENVLGWGK